MLNGMITDRVELDVNYVRDLAESIKAGTATEEQVQQYLNVHQKGAYTNEDLNRVEAAVQYVAAELNKYGYMPILPVTQSWSMTDKPNLKDFERYLSNVARIRNSLAVWASTPVAPTDMIRFDHNKANALEQILVDVDQILSHMKDAWFYLGDLYLAEV
jgi:hypothetical protein